MASLWKRKNSQYWTACFTALDGRQLKRSTGTTDRRQAEKLAFKFEEEARAKRTATQARRVLADIYKSISGTVVVTITVKKFFEDFVERKRPEVSAASHDYYQGHARRFLEWLGDRAERDISDVTKVDITTYRNYVATKAGPRTTNNTLKCLKTFFAAARKDGYLVEDPAADVDIVRDRSESARRPFTLDELRTVLATAGEEWRSLILFAFYSGQRLGDVASLTWGNLDLAKGELRLTTRKTGRRQVLPLPTPLRDHIASLSSCDDPRAPLHPRALEIMKRNNGRTGPLSKEFAVLLEQSGLRSTGTAHEGGKRLKHELSFHSLRHTATSVLKEAGIPVSVVMAFVGHDSDAVSGRYTHTGMEALEKAAAALPRV